MSTASTLTSAQFAALVKPGAYISDVKVTGSISWNVPNVTLRNVQFDTVELTPGADGAKLLGVKGRAFYIWGVSHWEIGEASVFDGGGVTSDSKLWDRGGTVGTDWVIRDSTFRNFYSSDPADHNQAIFVGSSTNGLIENNDFENNGNTGHIFVSSFGTNAITAGATAVTPSVCIRGNTFGPTHGAFFSVNVHPNEIPDFAQISIEPGQSSLVELSSNPAFVHVCPPR